jgi:hydrogenase/urease accessory protein HupE
MTLRFVVAGSFAIFAISVWMAFLIGFSHRDRKGHKDQFGLDDPSIRSCHFFAIFAISVWMAFSDPDFHTEIAKVAKTYSDG